MTDNRLQKIEQTAEETGFTVSEVRGLMQIFSDCRRAGEPIETAYMKASEYMGISASVEKIRVYLAENTTDKENVTV